MKNDERAEITIANHARALFDRFGTKAIAIAARRKQMCDQKGERENASAWNRIRLALTEMRGPAES